MKSQTEPIVEFSPSNYVGWEYSRPNFVFSSTSIIQYKIILYKTPTKLNYTLTSPLIDISQHQQIKVEFDWKATNYDQPLYSPTKGSPLIELIDERDNIIFSTQHQIEEATLIQDISVIIPVPTTLNSKVRLRLSAPKADVNSTGAVKNVKIYPDASSSIDDIQRPTSHIKIVNDNITISNTENKAIQITEATTGRVVYSTPDTPVNEIQVRLNHRGIYIITINTTPHKIIM